MTGKIYFILGSTFLMGLITGGYLYLSVFAPAYESDIGTSESTNNEGVVIEGQMQGGCMRSDNCASFKLNENGVYSYLATPDDEVQHGKLPKDITKNIMEYVGTETFFTDTEEITSDSCASFYDGIDYSYQVSLDDEIYTLDTCATSFGYDTEAKVVFINAWSAMENPTTTYPAIIEEGIGGFIKERFQNSGE